VDAGSRRLSTPLASSSSSTKGRAGPSSCVLAGDADSSTIHQHPLLARPL